MVEGSARPVDGAMAKGAIRGEGGLRVVGIVGCVVVRHMAPVAGARCNGEVIAAVALSARQCRMRSG